jgi:hypothetical protein
MDTTFVNGRQIGCFCFLPVFLFLASWAGVLEKDRLRNMWNHERFWMQINRKLFSL